MSLRNENQIKKCKCKNFIGGMMVHSVLKSQQIGQQITINDGKTNGVGVNNKPPVGAPGQMPPNNVTPQPRVPPKKSVSMRDESVMPDVARNIPPPTLMRNGLPAMAPVPLDLDFEKTEMKYDSTGMFHWTPARPIEECILVNISSSGLENSNFTFYLPCRIGTRRP